MTSKPLKYLFIHCSATRIDSPWTAKQIADYHLNTRGWSRPGYRTVIEADGTAVKLRKANNDAWVQSSEITWGAGSNYNPFSHHICYVGGLDANGIASYNINNHQVSTLINVIRYYIDIAPDILVIGHHAVANKDCPCLDLPTLLSAHGIPERNISKIDVFGHVKRWAVRKPLYNIY